MIKISKNKLYTKIICC